MALLKLAALGVALCLPTAAWGQTICNTRDSVVSQLSNKYKETTVAVGVTNTGGLVEVLSSPDGNTWTIIVTKPKGMSCLVLSGEGWRQMELDLAGPET
jgi:hypothetical protein